MAGSEHTMKSSIQKKSMIGVDIPYKDAIRSLEKMQQCVTPREKLQCLSESYGALKTAVVDFHKGKVSSNKILTLYFTIF